MPQDPALPLQGIHPENVPFQKLNTPVCSRSMPHHSKAWKRTLCPWSDDCIRRRMSIYTTEASSALKMCQENATGSLRFGKKNSQTKQNTSERETHTYHGKPFPSGILQMTPRNLPPGKKLKDCSRGFGCQIGGQGCGKGWDREANRSKPLPLEWVSIDITPFSTGNDI